jgi:phage recombination protein Bet
MTAVALQPQRPQPPSVIASMAASYGMRAEAFEATLRATVVPKSCTREEFAAFVLVAKEYRLNPVLREIYALPKKGGGIQPVVGVDGWYRIGNEHPQFDGIEFEDHHEDGLVAITARIWRKDRSRPIAVKEYLAECFQATEPWKKWPHRMLRHKAAIQGMRVAFGFSGIVDPDEAARFCMVSEEGRPRQLQSVNAHYNAGDGMVIEHQPDFDDPASDAYDIASADVPSAGGSTPAPANAPETSASPRGEASGAIPAEQHADPADEAYAAGRAAADAGVPFEDMPGKYHRYLKSRRAWQDGYSARVAELEGEGAPV